MNRVLLLNILLLAYCRAEYGYPSNYQSLDEWLNFTANFNSTSTPPVVDDDAFEGAGEEGPSICRLNYVSEFSFNCPAMSPTLTTSVHRLTASDVSVIGAMGDSITAAFGEEACTLVSIGNEWRGRSWSIGGDEDINTVLTLANIIKFYNPDLKGYSLGTGGPNSIAAKFNVAVAGAQAEDVPLQARELVRRIREDPEVDFKNDWKVVTMFIGGNDICHSCGDKDKYAPRQYVEFQRQALDYLHENLPRTFVNVVGIITMPEIGQLSSSQCDNIPVGTCFCALLGVRELTKQYQKSTEELIMSGRYDTSDNFTVVYQPFMEEVKIPLLENGEADASYFAPDCFHFSSRGHAVGAKDIWNNMHQPLGQKNVSMDFANGIACPSEEFPYFYTNLNSPQPEQSTTENAVEPGPQTEQSSTENAENSGSMAKAPVLILLLCIDLKLLMV